MMKRVIPFTLILVMCLSLCACNNASPEAQDPTTAPFVDPDADNTSPEIQDPSSVPFPDPEVDNTSPEIQDPSTAPFLDLDAYNTLKKDDPEQASKEYGGKMFRCTDAVVNTNLSEGKCYFGFEEFDPIFDLYITRYTLIICLANKEDIQKVKQQETYTFAGILDTSGEVPVLRDAQIMEE